MNTQINRNLSSNSWPGARSAPVIVIACVLAGCSPDSEPSLGDIPFTDTVFELDAGEMWVPFDQTENDQLASVLRTQGAKLAATYSGDDIATPTDVRGFRRADDAILTAFWFDLPAGQNVTGSYRDDYNERLKWMQSSAGFETEINHVTSIGNLTCLETNTTQGGTEMHTFACQAVEASNKVIQISKIAATGADELSELRDIVATLRGSCCES